MLILNTDNQAKNRSMLNLKILPTKQREASTSLFYFLLNISLLERHNNVWCSFVNDRAMFQFQELKFQ